MLHATLRRTTDRPRTSGTGKKLVIVLAAAVTALGLVQPVADAAPAATARSLSVVAKPSTAQAGTLITVSGVLTKSPKGTPVTVQRKSGAKWLKVRVAKTSKTGSYATRIALPSKAGSYKLRSVVAKKGSLKAATSHAISVTALTPVQATLSASPTSVLAGTDATLSGKVTPFVKGTTVSLQRLDSTTWRTVATTTLTATGAYSKAVAVDVSSGFRVSVPRVGSKSPAFSLTSFVKADPVISTTSLPGANEGDPYTATLASVGGAAGTWTVAPALPTGLTLAAATGTISGTPANGTAGTGQYAFSYKQTMTQLIAHKTLGLTIAAPVPPSIATSTLPAGTKGSAYTATLTATANVAGTWSASGLPAGLTLATGTGIISGTPTTVTTSTVTIGFTQTSTGLSALPKMVSLVVNAPPVPQILTTSLPNAKATVAYTTTLVASGGASGTWAVTTGKGPLNLAGYTLSTDGVLSGKGLIPHTYTFTVTFTNGDGTAVPVTLTLDVVAANSASTTAIVSAGGLSTCRVNPDQTLWCWGSDEDGQLGDNGTPGSNVSGSDKPVQIGTATDWDAVSVSGDNLPTESHACGIRVTAAYCWGAVGSGVGSTTSSGFATVPTLVPGNLSWASISAGWTNTCGVTTTGALYCWGDNQFGQLGTGGGDAVGPTRVGTGSAWTSVSSGYISSCGIQAPGTLYCWGGNSRGQLGIGSDDAQSAPTLVGSATAWTEVTSGDGYTCGLRAAGSVWCWGPSSNGQLGNGTELNDSSTDVLTPLQVGSATTWTSITAGGGQTCAVNAAGQLWCWGANGSGQLGNGTQTTGTGTDDHNVTAPARVGTDTDWASASAGQSHTCAAKTDGTIWCWGSNADGMLGINSSAQAVLLKSTPTAVVG